MAPNRPPLHGCNPVSTRSAATAMILLAMSVLRFTTGVLKEHRAPFTAHLITVGVVHHRRAAAVGASDDDAENC